MDGSLVGELSKLMHAMTFNFGSSEVFLLATFFCYHKDMWIAETDNGMYFHLIVVFPLTALFQLISFTASKFKITL